MFFPVVWAESGAPRLHPPHRTNPSCGTVFFFKASRFFTHRVLKWWVSFKVYGSCCASHGSLRVHIHAVFLDAKTLNCFINYALEIPAAEHVLRGRGLRRISLMMRSVLCGWWGIHVLGSPPLSMPALYCAPHLADASVTGGDEW